MLIHRARVTGGADRQHLRRAASVIAGGGIVAYPTDTLYALGVDPTRVSAVDRLCCLKQRTVGAGMPLVAGSLGQVESAIGGLPPLARRLARRFWPGPLTLVFDPMHPFAAGVLAEDGSVAVRVPDALVARHLADLHGGPITATSANPGGRTPASTGLEVAAGLGSSIGLILEQPLPLAGAPSTIVDVRGRRPTLIREGAVAWGRVLQSLT